MTSAPRPRSSTSAAAVVTSQQLAPLYAAGFTTASALVARLAPVSGQAARAAPHGFYKSIGHTLGPLLGGVVVAAGGLGAYFAVMAGLAAGRRRVALLSVPALPPLPRARPNPARHRPAPGRHRLLEATMAFGGGHGGTVRGCKLLAGFRRHGGQGPTTTGAAVSVLALTAALVQPGAALDTRKLTTGNGVTAGLIVSALGVAAAALPGVTGILTAAVAIGIGVITPLAFTSLARYPTRRTPRPNHGRRRNRGRSPRP